MNFFDQESNLKSNPESNPESNLQSSRQSKSNEPILKAQEVSVFYGGKIAIAAVNLEIQNNQIVAFIGGSGCGKSTLLRCFNRLNDLIPKTVIKGKILFNNQNIYDPEVDPVLVRRKIGMVFQRPSPFPKSIYENIAFGLRINGFKGAKPALDDLVEQALKSAALWDEVKDRLTENGLALSGGQQQRLCIARAIAIEPEAILMDEPCSALDPAATFRIEELIKTLKEKFAIVIVTHNMQQASRISDMTAFFATDDQNVGKLVEFDQTASIFNQPQKPATQVYIDGKY